MPRPLLDIFIPACQRDAEQLCLLAASLAFRLDPLSVNRLIVCQVTDPLLPSTRSKVHDALGILSSKTHFIRETHLGLPSIRNGWLSQQAAKLAFSAHSETTFYLVLDSKNILLDAVNLADLLINGKAPISVSSITAHPKWWLGSAWALRHGALIHRFNSGQRVLSSVPPVFLHTKSCYGLTSFIKGRFNKDISGFLSMSRPIRHRFMRPSEFSLYYTWMHKENLIYDLHYTLDTLQCGSYIWGRHSRPEVDALLEKMLSQSQSCLFSGIHWRAWMQLSAKQKQSLFQSITKP